ncbi:MAG TPA: 5-formyltetrahydrofolate cyclo-ligase [Sporolactobacillaceae bacterium]|nr:5-formyltetrahydrofolate cyclo-ligase [Sporolactobacillaceae bacterium]
MLDKKEWRGTIMSRLKRLSVEDRQLRSNAIYEHLVRLSNWATSETIGVTISTPNEIETRPIIEKAWEQAKEVAVPKCLPQTKQLDFRKLTHFSQLESVFYGLQEPIQDQTVPMAPEYIDLLIVPGLCFDSRGYRIGFGGGYYDRYLVHFNGVKVALAYEEQLIETVPEESHDIPVDFLITPSGVIPCTR